ncbi:PPP6R2 [Cordylochernes scorpioides]|uniref:PPP6R2 n=1 Tax=Cordylochernes scorpioides TaxID=51811 RepID=A0ABY6LG65_9ARAC|nr:PPP6R2 [Cordylochernes scorpioides]
MAGITHLTEPKILNEMVDLITQEPPEDVEEAVRYKYANIAAELLTSDVASINNGLIQDEAILNKLYNFLENPNPLNPLLASFFSKTLGMLIARKTAELFEFLKTKPDFVPAVIRHFNTSAIMDLLWKFIKDIDNPELRHDIAQWLTDQNTIEQLVDLISPDKEDNSYHDHAARVLSDIVLTSRKQMALMEEQASNYPLLLRLIDSQTITRLLENMKRDKTEKALVGGISVLDVILSLEIYRLQAEGLLPMPPQQLNGQLPSSPISRTWDESLPRLDLQVIRKKALADFHAIMLDPPKKAAIHTTAGPLDPPLGKTRLEIIKLYHILLLCNNPLVNTELAHLGVVHTILDLFFQYPWNNFLHTQVEHCLCTILNNSPTEDSEGQKSHPLLEQLFTNCNLVQRILDNWDPDMGETEGQQKISPAIGYRAHLTLIANQVAYNPTNQELITQHVQALPGDLPQIWDTFVSGPLADINIRNTITEVKSIAFQSSEAIALQQLGLSKDDEQEAWVATNQKMPPNILELNNLFDFSDPNDHNAELFEQVCNDRTDSDYSFQRNTWPELSKSHQSGEEEEPQRSTGSSSSEDSDEEEPSKPVSSAPEVSTNPFNEDLFSSDSAWTAQFPSGETENVWGKPTAPHTDNWADFSKLGFDSQWNPPPAQSLWNTEDQAGNLPSQPLSQDKPPTDSAPTDPFHSDPVRTSKYSIPDVHSTHLPIAPGSHNPFRPENASLLNPTPLEPTARARSLFSSLQFPTKDTSLVSLVLAEQPLVMELPLVSPASCELRSVIRFLAAKKNSAKDIHTELCQVYGEGCMSSGMVRRWVREFKNRRTDVHDEPRAGRPSVSDETIAKVEAAMLEDRRVTVRKLCDLVPDVSKTTIDKILREHLGYSKVCAIWVPKMLTEDHKRQRVYVAQKFLDCHKTDGEEFLDSIVTGDVTWVHYTTPETKEQSKQWNHISSPKPLKFKQTLSAGKLMATVFWDRKGLLLCDFMRLGTTINSDRYCKTLKQLRRAIQNKRRGMLTKGVRFHHDNARPHTARQTTALIEEFEWELVSHPPYSPDVAPSDFHFFPELKKNLGGTQFQDDDELEEAVLGFYVARRQSSSTLGSIRKKTVKQSPVVDQQDRTKERLSLHVVQAMIIMQFEFALTNVPEPLKTPAAVAAVIQMEGGDTALISLSTSSSKDSQYEDMLFKL